MCLHSLLFLSFFFFLSFLFAHDFSENPEQKRKIHIHTEREREEKDSFFRSYFFFSSFGLSVRLFHFRTDVKYLFPVSLVTVIIIINAYFFVLLREGSWEKDWKYDGKESIQTNTKKKRYLLFDSENQRTNRRKIQKKERILE